MVKYRRLKIAGGTYFFTVNLRNRKQKYLTQYISHLKDAFRRTREEMPFKTIALVVLHEHIHAIWELPDGDDDFSARWRKIKRYFTQALLKKGVSLNSNKRREYNLWQLRFWEHAIRNDKDFEQHVNYIHYNPVKHRLVKKVKHWPYSTFHQYVRMGVLPESWGDLGECDDIFAGEVATIE